MKSLIQLDQALDKATTGLERTALLVDFWSTGELKACANELRAFLRAVAKVSEGLDDL